MSLERRTPLERGSKPLSRGAPMSRGKGLERGSKPLQTRKPMERGAGPKRTAMKPSASPAAHTAAEWEATIRPGLWARSGGRCERCGKPLEGQTASAHHRRGRGAGGTSLTDVDDWPTLLLLCGSGTTGCHGHVEHNRTEAYEAGWLVRRNGQALPAEVPVLLWDGRRVLLARDTPTYVAA